MLDILDTIVYVIAAASVISSITPTKKDDAIVAKIMKYVDMLSLNIGQVKKRIQDEGK
jgi:hypothetical protein